MTTGFQSDLTSSAYSSLIDDFQSKPASSASSSKSIKRCLSLSPVGFHRILYPSQGSIYTKMDLDSPEIPRRNVLKSRISPIASSSMGAIEEKVGRFNIEDEVKLIQQRSMETIRRRRAQSLKAPPGEFSIAKMVEEIPEIQCELKKTKKQLKKRASLAPGRIAHVKKKSIGDNRSGHPLAYSKTGRVYVHIRNTVFAYGQHEVKLGLELTTQEIVVINKRTDYIYSPPVLDKYNKIAGDIKVMKLCKKCKNIAVPYGFATKENEEMITMYVFSKYYRGGDLDGKVFEGSELYQIALGLAKGLKKMHRKGLVHCDLKPENMFYHEGIPVIADFDTVKSIEDVDWESDKTIQLFTRGTSGTAAYKPPETANSMHQVDPFCEEPVENTMECIPLERQNPLKYAQLGDMYSFGLCLFQLSRKISAEGASRKIRHVDLVKASQRFRRQRPLAALDGLIFDMLQGDPLQRPTSHTVVSVLKHLFNVQR